MIYSTDKILKGQSSTIKIFLIVLMFIYCLEFRWQIVVIVLFQT